mgnify:FL=1
MPTILVPLDSSEIAAKVLLVAEALASKLQSKLLLYHVIEPVTTPVPMGASLEILSTSPASLDLEQTESARRRLEELAAPLRARGLDVDCEASFGIPVNEIIDVAGTQAVDYIVLGSHGRGGLFHLFAGSVVTGVLKQSPCPVVVVPARK